MKSDVFYLFEPLNELRMVTYGDRNLGEWPRLDEKGNEAYRTDFSNLLQDIFTCNFERNNTLELIFPSWLRKSRSGKLAWKNKTTVITKESVAELSLQITKDYSYQNHADQTSKRNWNA